MRETIEEIKTRVKKSQKNYQLNMSFIESILFGERGYVSKVPEKEDVVVLYSGGLDSTVMIDQIINEWDVRVNPLFVKRSARNEKYEEEAFDYFVGYFSNKFPGKIANPFKLTYQVPPKEFKQMFQKELSLTQGLPLRNSTLSNLAVMYAVALNGKYDKNVKTVLVGSVGDDTTEPETGLLSLRVQTLNTCIQLADWKWQVTSPLTDLFISGTDEPVYKMDLIKYAVENGIPLEKTRSCFSSYEIPDGTCIACFKRKKAFESLGLADPLKYQDQDQNQEQTKNNGGKNE
jgi:7-cyano-7-deazaguanine synthase in queuosine biosynthesis